MYPWITQSRSYDWQPGTGAGYTSASDLWHVYSSELPFCRSKITMPKYGHKNPYHSTLSLSWSHQRCMIGSCMGVTYHGKHRELSVLCAQSRMVQYLVKPICENDWYSVKSSAAHIQIIYWHIVWCEGWAKISCIVKTRRLIAPLLPCSRWSLFFSWQILTYQCSENFSRTGMGKFSIFYTFACIST